VRGNDFYTPRFTLPTNSPPTHQPHSMLSYPFRTLYFGAKFEPSRTLYFGTEGVVQAPPQDPHIRMPSTGMATTTMTPIPFVCIMCTVPCKNKPMQGVVCSIVVVTRLESHLFLLISGLSVVISENPFTDSHLYGKSSASEF
jgi:hypothetical protein